MAAELDIAEGVAYHYTFAGSDSGIVHYSLRIKPGEWLSACAFVLIVRAEIEPVNVRAVFGESSLEGFVNGVYIIIRVQPECDAALIGDNDHPRAGAVQLADGLGNTWENVEIAGSPNVPALGHFLIDHAIAVKEDGSDLVSV